MVAPKVLYVYGLLNTVTITGMESVAFRTKSRDSSNQHFSNTEKIQS